jgi:hypothetical protein
MDRGTSGVDVEISLSSKIDMYVCVRVCIYEYMYIFVLTHPPN